MLYLPGAESLLTSVSTSGVASDWRLGRFESRGACCPSSQILFALRFLIWNVASSQTEPGALRRRASWEQLLVQGIRSPSFLFTPLIYSTTSVHLRAHKRSYTGAGGAGGADRQPISGCEVTGARDASERAIVRV